MTQSTGIPSNNVNSPSSASSDGMVLEAQIRARIESMSYLPTTVAVAMKFVELGKNPEAEPGDYAKVIGADSSLSTKLLSLANSSWFGVRNRVTKVHVAVNLLGLSTVRALAISYCATGLHNELRLDANESRMFWSASLAKAVAAKQYALLHDAKLAEEAFAAGLFQDFALPVMYATCREKVLPMLQDMRLDWKTRLQNERTIFHLDHAELGRSIAQKLELPELFVDAVAFHHNHASLREFVAAPVLADAIYVAALFPHLLAGWNPQDAQELHRFITEQGHTSPETWLAAVQQEVDQLYRFFDQGGGAAESQLTTLLENATREIADNTTHLVSTVHELMQQAAAAGKEMHQLLHDKKRIEDAAMRDALTGVLNRSGFTEHAQGTLAAAARYGIGCALVYLDIDRFKTLNDTCGHASGDAALQALAHFIQRHIRQNDLIGRLGGDEFVILLNDCSEADAVQAVGRVLTEVAAQPFGKSGAAGFNTTVSAGLAWIKTPDKNWPLDKLLSMADALMYQSKRNGGNRLHSLSIPTPEKDAA